MPSRIDLISRLVAHLLALLPADWTGRAGERFRKTLSTVSKFSEQHQVRPGDLAHEGVAVARNALHGVANQKLAAAMKDFAQAEQAKIDAELQRRSLKSKVRKEEAEARLAEAKALDAEVELFKKLTEIGVLPRFDERGNLIVLPLPQGLDLRELARSRSLAAGESD